MCVVQLIIINTYAICDRPALQKPAMFAPKLKSILLHKIIATLKKYLCLHLPRPYLYLSNPRPYLHILAEFN